MDGIWSGEKEPPSWGRVTRVPNVKAPAKRLTVDNEPTRFKYDCAATCACCLTD